MRLTRESSKRRRENGTGRATRSAQVRFGQRPADLCRANDDDLFSPPVQALRHFEESVKLYELAIKLDPTAFEGHYNLSVLSHFSLPAGFCSTL